MAWGRKKQELYYAQQSKEDELELKIKELQKKLILPTFSRDPVKTTKERLLKLNDENYLEENNMEIYRIEKNAGHDSFYPKDTYIPLTIPNKQRVKLYADGGIEFIYRIHNSNKIKPEKLKEKIDQSYLYLINLWCVKSKTEIWYHEPMFKQTNE
jgi:hypothetical protein